MLVVPIMRDVLRIITAATMVAGLALAGSAAAAPINPVSYDTVNGNGFASGGSFNYWDRDYSGTGSVFPFTAPHTADGETLTGGLGDLTDGVIPTQDWNLVENLAGDGPYVGWLNIDPTITFHFGSSVNIDTVTLYLADSNSGGVGPPASVDIDGTNHLIADPAGSAPFSVSFSGLGFTGSSLTLQLFRGDPWIFLSEVTFDGTTAIPAPGGLLLLGMGVTGFGLFRRRRSIT